MRDKIVASVSVNDILHSVIISEETRQIIQSIGRFSDNPDTWFLFETVMKYDRLTEENIIRFINCWMNSDEFEGEVRDVWIRPC
ncbi:MAG: hypothetical protein Q7S19_01725 [bacterium]|nr:hypothetical protein [bacterium]